MSPYLAREHRVLRLRIGSDLRHGRTIARGPDRRAILGTKALVDEEPAASVVRKLARYDEGRRSTARRPDRDVARQRAARRERHAVGKYLDDASAEREAYSGLLQGAPGDVPAWR